MGKTAKLDLPEVTPMNRILGKTSLSVSPIAFGAFKIGRNQKIKYANPYDLPSDAETEKLLNDILDLGINLIDTAPAYGISEQRIGQFLSHRRNDFLLSSKVGETFENGASIYDFSEKAVRFSLDRSLNRLKTDHLDLCFIHSGPDDLKILTDSPCPAILQEYKEKGKIRFIGFSGKTPAAASLAMNWADVLMIEYHPGDLSHESIFQQAHAKNIGILIKKPLASGKLPPEKTIPWLLQNKAIASLVVGGLNLDHMKQNLQCANNQLAIGNRQ